ncbi:hypothetical protein C8R44DRAFT_923158 [Mycena epipterygia]|nr:hypothetical protein C8R44DRAFT_923158 [Mycena epipterygia]
MYPQGVDSLTFSPGSLDGSLTIPQLLDRHLEHSPNHPAYIYDDPKGEIVAVTFSQYIRTVHAACRYILRDTHSLGGPGTIIGIFATTSWGCFLHVRLRCSHSISYCLLVAAIQRNGMVPFCISPRSAPEGLANLLTQTKTAAVYISPDSQSKSVLSEALAIGGAQVLVFDAPTFEQLQGELDASSEPLPPLPSAALDSTALILHTSGKLHYSPPSFHFSILEADLYVPQDNFAICSRNGDISRNLTCFDGLDNRGVPSHDAPDTVGRCGRYILPDDDDTLHRPTPENALDALIVTKPDLVLSTPASIEAWSDNPVGLQMMQSIKCLTYVGAPLNRRVGDALVSKGVALCSTYGAMEVGVVTAFFRCHGKNWDYFAVEKQVNAVRVPEEDESPFYTHTYLVNPSYATCYTNAEVDGKPGCSVRDLLEQHPENPELHRVYGRKDDLIVFSSAAKMNPGPVVTDFIEAHVNRNPLVDGAVVFGEGKTRPGVIIQLKSEFQADLQDEGKRSKVLDALWASVDESNRSSPTHFQIPRELVVLADPQKPFALTSKLQPRRRVIFEDYREEIHAA